MTNDIIISQLREMFKGMIEEVLREERKEYLKEHPETRGNGYYVRRPKTIMGEMEIRVPIKRNIKNRVRRRHWGEILKELNEIIKAENPSEGAKRLKEFIDKWSRIYRFMRNLEEETKHYTHFFKSPNGDTEL